ncbi:E2 protein [Papillomaviridae sp. Haddock_c2655]|nr:E2 protein [Papillomaviridae sp. Haddock_c2655]
MSAKIQAKLLALDKVQFKLKQQLAKSKNNSYQEVLAVVVLDEQKLQIEVELREHHDSRGTINIGHLIVPNLSICRARLRVQQRLMELLTSFSKSPYVSSTTWDLQELTTEQIFHTEPKGVIKSTPRLRVATQWWKNFYFQIEGVWKHSFVDKPDKKGLYYVRDGRKLYYHLFPQILTKTDVDKTTDKTDQSKHDNLSRTRKRGLRASTSSSETDGGNAKSFKGQPKHGRSGRRVSTRSLSPERTSKRAAETSTEGVAAALVGSDKLSTRGGVGKSRLARLISEAVDPPGLCISGSIETLKGVRRRLIHPTTPSFQSYTMTTKSYNRDDTPASKPFFLIFFNSTEERWDFLQGFKIYAKSVTVSRIHFNGLPAAHDSQED